MKKSTKIVRRKPKPRVTRPRDGKSRDGHLRAIALDTLSVFEKIAQRARALLSAGSDLTADVRATGSPMVGYRTSNNLGEVAEQLHSDRQVLAREPAVARIVAQDDQDNMLVYFVARGAPPTGIDTKVRLASYRSPLGRIASIPLSEEFETIVSGRRVSLQVVERSLLRPTLTDGAWDSVGSTIQTPDFGVLTVHSFRELLRTEAGEAHTLLENLLSEDSDANVLEGLRRSVLRKMTLRDQPVLDTYQDAIFRLPIDSNLILLGPPGTGKTTTLIRRLGQKLDIEYLDDHERRLVLDVAKKRGVNHRDSWMMFTPTELLKQYVKEAFAREGIAASDLRIATWTDFRRDLARNSFGILRRSTGGGLFVLRDGERLDDDVISTPKSWFAAFNTQQSLEFWTELSVGADELQADADPKVSNLGTKLLYAIRESKADAISALTALVRLEDEVQSLVVSKRSETDSAIEKALNFQVNRNRQFLDDLATTLESMAATSEDDDGDDSDEEEDQPSGLRIGRRAAASAYMRYVRAQARGLAAKRSPARNSKLHRVVEWLGDRSLGHDELLEVGKRLLVLSAARKFSNPVTRYIDGIPGRYRKFRREQEASGRWYRSSGQPVTDISPLEVDGILLAILLVVRALLKNRTIKANIANPRYERLRDVEQLFRNQVVVDEATDFSAVQLACMAALSDPTIGSFFACGDFNQRMTTWGSRTLEDVRWAVPGINVQSIEITYRHSRQLANLARKIVESAGGRPSSASLPVGLHEDGVNPVLGVDLSSTEAVVRWTAERIKEIERLAGAVPTVAVLVNGEQMVGPIASALDAELSTANIRAVACANGQVVGRENDVRVFDVQHIKGLEFEAAFFVGVDDLALESPDIFDKYLYVGATRAATYLGLTCRSGRLPDAIAPLASDFTENWRFK